ncbi:OmpA family protein [Aquirhabdus parva]|uniref:OmpA family protein n=1 Tax=Aquirhabdus parva TaxID=2283318 RepID=A0A345P8X0_9GAMM|nr:OmpA family protein [Aquirhabdus parva]AXI03729.1 OmpA family protein [Aquirhabdus parva]
MKLNRVALAVLLAAPLSVAVHAETTGLGLTVTPMVGWQGFDSSAPDTIKQPGSQVGKYAPYGEGFKPYGDVLGAIAIGYELTPSLSIEAQYNETRNQGSVHVPGGTINGEHDGRVRSIEGNFLLNSDFITHDYDGKFKPYILIGAGHQELNVNDKGFHVKSQDTIANLGLGAFYRINDALALRVEGRGVENTDHSLLDWKAFTGLQITLGGHKRPYVAPAPVEVPPPAPVPVVVPAPAPQVLTEDLKLELRVFFDTNKSIIKKQYQPEIAKVADKLKEFSNASAEIKGYTDSTGSRKLNDRLSQARAESVKSSLVKDYGIDAGRLTAKGYSWDEPVASNKTKEGRALNRRVVAVITGSRTVTK